MNFKLAKTLLMGSIVSMGAFGLVACGDDSSSNPPPPAPASSSSQEQGSTTNSAEINAPDAIFGSRTSGHNAKFTGTFNISMADDESMADELLLDAISIKVAQGEVVPGASFTPIEGVVSYDEIALPTDYIDIGSGIGAMNVVVDMDNPAFEALGCGTYTLIVHVDGHADEKKIESNKYVTFQREAAEFCREPEVPSSSSTVQEISMKSCLVTVMTDLHAGFNLATCEAVPVGSPADIVITKVGSRDETEFNLSSGAGTYFTPITNNIGNNFSDDYEANENYWPEQMSSHPGVTYASDFLYATGISGISFDNLLENSSQIFVAKTAAYDETTKAGFYAFGINNNNDPTQKAIKNDRNNGNYTFVIKVYSAQ